MQESVTHKLIRRWRTHAWSSDTDAIAVESPLQIRLRYGPSEARITVDLAILMRSPGEDIDLVTGFLFAEDIIRSTRDVLSIKYTDVRQSAAWGADVMLADLRPDCEPNLNRVARQFYSSSSCGVCGKQSLSQLECEGGIVLPAFRESVSVEVIRQVRVKLRGAQRGFDETGGAHAVALFSLGGDLRFVCEDVGRHNAMDKLLGQILRSETSIERGAIVVVSGRASFELVQKALMIGIPILVSVGAPSSLAIEFAEAHGMTLIGFLKNDSFNVYANESRIDPT